MTNQLTTAPVNPGVGAPGGSRCEPLTVKKGRSLTNVPARSQRWNPWKALVLDHPDVSLSTQYQLPERYMGLQLGRRIWLCKSMNPVEQDCTLAHELVHRERGPMPTAPAARAAEEQIVDTIAAHRMVPLRDLFGVVWQRPNASLDVWAYLLLVDQPTLKTRLLTLTPTERAALNQARGRTMPSVLDLEPVAS